MTHKKYKAIVISSIAFLVLTFIDFYVTYKVGVVAKYLEANPLFQYIGFSGIILLNVFIVGVIYWRYSRSTNIFNRFIYLNLLISISITRILVIVSNYRVMQNPPTLEVAKQVTTAMKQAAVSKYWWLGFLPYTISLITFFLFMIDHHINIK